MLENLQRTSTTHVGLQPNSQVSVPEDIVSLIISIEVSFRLIISENLSNIVFIPTRLVGTLISHIHSVAFLCLYLSPFSVFKPQKQHGGYEWFPQFSIFRGSDRGLNGVWAVPVFSQSVTFRWHLQFLRKHISDGTCSYCSLVWHCLCRHPYVDYQVTTWTFRIIKTASKSTYSHPT